jgi:hypothetical protein
MLENDPPPGTPVRFVRPIGKARTNETASLVGSTKKYLVDRDEDEFEVDSRGERMTVQREDIEKVVRDRGC